MIRTQQQIELSVSLLKQAKTIEAIKKETGLDTLAIYLIQEKYGLEKPWIIRKRIRDAAVLKNKEVKVSKNLKRDQEIVALAKSGITLKEIAFQYGVTSERIRKILCNNNALKPKEARKQKNDQSEELKSEKSKLLSDWVRAHMGCTIVELALGTGIEKKDHVTLLPKEMTHLILKPGEATNSNTWTIKKWSDNQILDSIRHAGAVVSPLSHKSYDRIRKNHSINSPSARLILKRFHFWNIACETAGVKPGQGLRTNYHRQWSEKDLVNWLAEFMRHSNTSRRVAYDQWSKMQVGAPGPQTIRNTIGAWSECCQLALLALRKEWTEN